MKSLIILSLAYVAYGSDPKRCCVGNIYSASLLQFGATKPANADAAIADNSFLLDYDYDAKKLRLMGTSRDTVTGVNHNLTIVEDFKVGRIYTVLDQQCSVVHVPPGTMTPPCIPDSLMFEGNFTIGGGDDSLNIQSWKGLVNGLDTRITVTDDCYPVTMYNYGTDRDNSTAVLYSYAFSDIQKGQLSEVDPFRIPDECKIPTPAVG